MATEPSAQGKGTNRRRFPRRTPLSFRIPVRVDTHAADLVDVSLLGLRVEMDMEYLPGALLPVELTVGPKCAVFRALVRRTEPTCILDEGDDFQVRYQLALEFLRDPGADGNLLEDLVTLLNYSNWVVDRSGRA